MRDALELKKTVLGTTNNSSMPFLPESSFPLREARWSLAFIGTLGYLFVEYMRISAQYQVLLPFHVGKVIVVVMALGWLVSPRLRYMDRASVRALDIAMVSLLFMSFFSTLFAKYSEPAWEGYIDLLKWGLIFFLLGRIVTSSWRYRIFIFLFLLLNLKMAQAGVRYFYHARAYWGETIAIREGARAGTVGFFSNSADFGVAMCVAWPIAVMLLFSKPGKVWRVVLLACSIIMLVAIMVCGSRGAAVGAVCTVLAGAFIARRKLAIGLMALLLIPGIIFVIPEASKVRFQSAWDYQQDRTAMNRITFWKAGLRMFGDHPLFGVGPKNYPPTLITEDERYGVGRLAVPHSTYIEVLAELGTGGMVPFLALLFFFFRLNAKTRKHLQAQGIERRSFEFCMSQGLDLAMIGYLSSGAFVAVFAYPHLWVLSGLSVALYITSAAKQVESAQASLPTEAAPLEVAVPQGG
jgi:putative inorganic carbon (HCO3(-)) transporter